MIRPVYVQSIFMKTKLIPGLILFTFLAINSVAQPSVGEDAYEISLPDVNGNKIALSSLKGKVVLLDFWASWCGPCRYANKRVLTRLYSKYKSKGFEIYGVSLDEEESDWTKAIKKDKISWIQVNDPAGWRSKIAAQWGVNAIPASFLIDELGMMVAIDMETDKIEQILQKVLVKNKK